MNFKHRRIVYSNEIYLYIFVIVYSNAVIFIEIQLSSYSEICINKYTNFVLFKFQANVSRIHIINIKISIMSCKSVRIALYSNVYCKHSIGYLNITLYLKCNVGNNIHI